MIELDGGLGFRTGGGKVTVVYPPHRQARKDASREYAIDRRGRSRSDKAIFERAIMFLFDRCVEKRAVLDDRAAEGRAGAIAVETWRCTFCLKWIARIQRAVLQEKESVAVELVRADSVHDIDGAAGGTARLG